MSTYTEAYELYMSAAQYSYSVFALWAFWIWGGYQALFMISRGRDIAQKLYAACACIVIVIITVMFGAL